MKPVAVVLGMYEPGAIDYEIVEAFLFTKCHVMYVFAGTLWVREVIPAPKLENLYVDDTDGNALILAENVKGENGILVPKLIQQWRSISGLEFIINEVLSGNLSDLELSI